MSERLIEGDGRPEDQRIERAVRPKTLAEYEGQPKVRDQMQLFVDAARGRNEPLDHTLIFGPPGLVDYLANIVAHEMGSTLKSTSALYLSAR
jgi:Holliday junction resolvasome, helicase subunit